MDQIAIQDANILIDLITIEMFSICLSSPYRFVTTEIILAELHDHQIEKIQPYIRSGKFAVIPIPTAELMEIQSSSLEDERLSLQDWSAIFYAQKLKALLVTGDKRLRTLAETKGLKVCGILRLFDELVKNSIISQSEACLFLKHLLTINRRLPADECSSRISTWCKE